VNNKDYPASLELRKLYQIVADEAAAKHQQLRVIDESGEDYSLSRRIFRPCPVNGLLFIPATTGVSPERSRRAPTFAAQPARSRGVPVTYKNS
jgi:hypothetical protein